MFGDHCLSTATLKGLLNKIKQEKKLKVKILKEKKGGRMKQKAKLITVYLGHLKEFRI